MAASLAAKFPQLRLVVEHRYVRDHQAPLSADDIDFECGWQSIPIPPTIDERWKIFDTRKDRKTGWRRFHIKWVAP